MTAPLQVGGIYEVRAWLLQAEQVAVNTWHYFVLNTVGTAVNDTDMALTLETDVASKYKALLSTDTQFRGVQVTLKNPAPGVSPPATIFSNTLFGNGSAAEPDCPRQCSGLIHWSSPLGGRRNRGRTYFPFPTAGNLLTNGQPTAAYQTSLAAFATALLNRTTISNAGALGTATVDLVIYHRPIPPAAMITPTPVTGFVVPAKFATQKRRGSYGRPNSSPI
jgi:hypothetical protein